MTTVLALMDTVTVSGPARQLLATLPPLAARGITLVPATLGLRADTSPYKRWLETEGIPHVAVKRVRYRELASGALVRALAHDCGAHLVQTHSYRPAVGALMAKVTGLACPWVAFFHGHTAETRTVRLYNAIDRIALRFADTVVTVAGSQQAYLGLGDRVQTIPNAVLPAERSHSVLLPQRPRADVLLGFAGRLSYEKGVDLLLEALAEVRRGLDAHLWIAGTGPEAPRLHAQVAALGLTDVVHFLGHLAGTHEFLRTIDALVLPSRSEGMPNILLEAAAMDTPMVATAVGDVAEILQDARAGRVVAPEAVSALSTAMVDVVQKGRTAEGQAARRAIGDRFSLETRVARLEALYRAVTPAGGAFSSPPPAP